MNKIIAFIALHIFIITGFYAAALAQSDPFGKSDEPLEITADGSLEWHRNQTQFIARKNALAKQGDVSISSDLLTADYRETKETSIEIWQVQADGNVVINSKTSNATGQRAVYNLDQGYAEMTGDNLKLMTPDQTVTAQDRFEYWVTAGRLLAIGNAQLITQDEKGRINTLTADKLAAVLKDNPQGRRELSTLEAEGNIIIKTPTETLSGQKGIYNRATNTAQITGDVSIRRGPNVLQGERAEINMTTNVSKMFGGSNPTERVRGVFYPGSEDTQNLQ